MSPLLVFSGRQVLLPDTDIPQPATVIIDTFSGKITNILPGQLSRDDLSPHLAQDSEIATYIEAGNKVVLPGLIE